MDDLLYRRIPETAYLDTENTPRYRAILRFFFEQHERLRHYLFPEEILAHLHQLPRFQGYGMADLQADLNALVEKKNLNPRQDTTRVTSIHDFKNKRFRYQATPYTIEIERLVRKLAQLGQGFGGSLEITLFDSLLQRLKLLVSSEKDADGKPRFSILQEPDDKIYQLWSEMFDCFRKMGENASDYLAHLKTEKVEERMQTEAFLVYKDAFKRYLENFVVQLQRAAAHIEQLLGGTDPTFVEALAGRLARHEAAIPRLDGDPPDPEELAQGYRLKWRALYEWFHGTDGRRSEWLSLQDETTDTIRRLTRFAQRIGERLLHAHGRRKDYLHLAKWFARLDSLEEAHQLSGVVFGVERPRHLTTEHEFGDDTDVTIWHHPPAVVKVKPSVRTFRERSRPNPVHSYANERDALLRAHLRQKESERQLVERIIRDRRIVLSDLDHVDPYIRKTLLDWIGRCTASPRNQTRAETGHRVRLAAEEGRVLLESEDGLMEMPNYTFSIIDNPGSHESNP
ncbi:TIGR02677 family protein [Sulfidibacter corallicola]|uniref:TIGR02677 family protein n=1 Tax=Sulfidibacter corallicola TaxID=2818388 RepID=A0A8A4TTW4_SULCO|nr:TIGR02677 family protein [Sulfidibacter corallicola]QTD53399.1 TIGR02677 family protein [Sulfidibacter corallicola]